MKVVKLKPIERIRIGSLIKLGRNQKRMQVGVLATRTGQTNDYIVKLERGVYHQVSMALLEKIQELLGVDLQIPKKT